MRTWAPSGVRRVGGFVSAAMVTIVAAALVVAVTKDATAVSPPFTYGEALQKAIWFYDAQRLGHLPANNRASWRGDAFMQDGADAGLDLTGGFADAGDHIKATFPMAHSMTTLAWGMVEYPDAYANTGQANPMLSNLRWGMDWHIKAHPSANKLVAEVGDPNLDHQLWASAEVQTYKRDTYFIDASCGGSDLARSAASAVPASPLAFSASELLLAKLTGKAQYVTDVTRWADYTTDRTNGFNGEKATYSPGGQIFYNTWGSLRYATGAAWLAFIASDSGRLDTARNQRLAAFAAKQVNYTLGDNPANVSYMVRFGANYIKRPHHRTAHGSWAADFYSPVEDRHTLYGALIGGPTAANDTYGAEDRNDFTKAEVALDYNAAYTAALGRMWMTYGGTALASFPPKETPDGPEIQVTALAQQVNANPGDYSMQFQTFIQNLSAWSARALTNAKLRYFFTLDPGVSPSQVAVTSSYKTCLDPGGQVPQQFSGNTYYVTIDCTGTAITPTGQ